MKIEVLDSTLRDGAQSEKISYSLSDKIAIAILLNKIGIHYIEAGFSLSNPKDEGFFKAEEIKKINAITSFTSTRKKDEKAADSPLLKVKTNTVSIFGKTSVFHVETILQCTKEENLVMIFDSVSCLKSQGKKVIFDAEHFFDGFKEDKDYALAAIASAKNAGADIICLCDTNGSSLPQAVYHATKEVSTMHPNSCIGIHCHDDMGLSSANTIMAVQAGARHIQGTFIGTGERCGNANLCTIISNLQLKYGYEILKKEQLKLLTQTANAIAEISNLTLPANMPYVGRSAFSHKAGMHGDGVIKSTASFEHISPEIIGNNRKLLLSELSGKAVVMEKIKELCPEIDTTIINVSTIVAKLKEMEKDGYQYEGAEASFKLLVLKALKSYTPTFKLIKLKCIIEQPRVDGMAATATVKITAFDKTVLKANEGEGPVHAIDKALRLALEDFYPIVKNVTLLDYKVRVLSSNEATAAKVRVLITSTDGYNIWTTVGVSADIIEASWIALVDSFEYKILSK